MKPANQIGAALGVVAVGLAITAGVAWLKPVPAAPPAPAIIVAPEPPPFDFNKLLPHPCSTSICTEKGILLPKSWKQAPSPDYERIKMRPIGGSA